MEHEVIPAGERHGPHNWEVADQAARLALSTTIADVGKTCWQRSDNNIWICTAAGAWAVQGAGNSGEMTALNALAQAARRRVDVLLVGDSNIQQSGYGYNGGWQKKLGSRFGTYATAIASMGIGLTGSAYASAGPSAPTVATGAPAGLNVLFPPATKHSYAYLPDGQTQANAGGMNLLVSNIEGGIDIKALLRSHVVWAGLDSGTGSFRQMARLGYAPNTTILTGSLTNTNVGTITMRRSTATIAADASRTGSGLDIQLLRGATLTGPFFGVFQRLENSALMTGVSVSQLTAAGGWSLYDMAADVIATADATLTAVLRECRYLQLAVGQTPIIVVRISSGVNDQNETLTPSLGPNPSSAPTSATAYEDNLDAVKLRVEAIYNLNNWPLTELYWLVVPSHPIASTDSTLMAAYRVAARGWVNKGPRRSIIDYSTLITHDQILANGWYASSGSDKNHLTAPDGYDGMAALEIAQIPALA